jgi:imidazolonepropionase-like amidohydrolase
MTSPPRRRAPRAPRSPLAGIAPLGVVLAFALALGPVTALAQDLYIVGGTVHTLDGPARVATVIVRDGLVAAVDEAATPGPDDHVIDATGRIVTPGLVDFGTALGAVEIWAVRTSRDTDPGGDEIRAAFRIADAINPQSVLIAETRRGGVTSVVTHPSGGLIAGQSAWLDLAGERADQMVVLAPVTMDLGFGAGAASVSGGSRAGTLLRYRELFADVLAYRDAPSAYDAGQMRELSASRLDLESLVPLLEGQLTAYVAVERQSDIIAAVGLAEEYGFSLVITNGDEAWAVADLLAERGVPVVLDPLRNAPASFESLGARADNAALLEAAGVPVILTTGEAHNVRLLRQYAGNAVRAGMSWEGALAAVTLNPARAAGLDDRYGRIAPGMVANLVVWSGDPFELSTHPEAVIVHGRQTSLESRQQALFRRYRTLEDGRNRRVSP